MTATKNLENDHVFILRLTDVMEKMIMKGNTDQSHLETVIWLIREYADGFHHAKEENLLFPLMEQKGFSAVQGPVAVMLHEHVMGREYLREMAEGTESLKKGDLSAFSKIYLNMQGYIDLLRNHISKENNILFRMADRSFSSTEQEELLDKFYDIEKNLSGKKGSGHFIAEIERLEDLYH